MPYGDDRLASAFTEEGLARHDAAIRRAALEEAAKVAESDTTRKPSGGYWGGREDAAAAIRKLAEGKE